MPLRSSQKTDRPALRTHGGSKRGETHESAKPSPKTPLGAVQQFTGNYPTGAQLLEQALGIGAAGAADVARELAALSEARPPA